MTAPAPAPAPAPARTTARPGPADTLASPGLVRHNVPAAGASVMGTGIIGIAAHTLPVHIVGLAVVANVSWLLAAVMLIGVVGLNVLQLARHPEVSRAHLLDRRTAPATGTLAMAFLTVGTATLLIGSNFLGGRLGGTLARDIDFVLFTIGTVLGLVTTVGIPLLLITRPDHGGHTDVAATWLLPVVPPMVSAAAGGLLAQHMAVGTARSSLIVLSLLFFGMSLLAGLLMISVLRARLLVHGSEALPATPSLWVVLGPLGQGATALATIAIGAEGTLPSPYPAGLAVVALVGGTTLLGFALMWAALSGLLTARAARRGMPFHLGWWSFTFPVGTCVTGLSALAGRVDAPFLRVLAVGAFAGLVMAWLIVARSTIIGIAKRTLASPLAG